MYALCNLLRSLTCWYNQLLKIGGLVVVVVVEQLVSMCCFDFDARLGPSVPEAFVACDSM